MKISVVSLAALASLVSGAAVAQSYTLKLGGAYIDPRANSSDFEGRLPSGVPTLGGVTLAVQPKSTVMFSIERAINDQFAVELVLGVPPKHEVELKVASNVSLADGRGRLFSAFRNKAIAEVKQVAPTVFFNWKLGQAADAVRPYVGLGINYTKMDAELNAAGESLYRQAGATAVKLNLRSSIAPAIQAGVSYQFDRQWSLNAGLVTTFVSSTLTVSTQNAANGRYEHTAKFNFTPVVYAASVGYAF